MSSESAIIPLSNLHHILTVFSSGPHSTHTLPSLHFHSDSRPRKSIDLGSMVTDHVVKSTGRTIVDCQQSMVADNNEDPLINTMDLLSIDGSTTSSTSQ